MMDPKMKAEAEECNKTEAGSSHSECAGANDNVGPSEMFKNVYPSNNGENDEEFQMTRHEMEQIQAALKKEEFCKLLSEYVHDVRDPANQLTFQSELRELEKQRGNTVHFVNPIAGYVLKTSINGQKKCFINMCSNPLIKKPSFETAARENKVGQLWSIPHSPSTGRDDVDKAGTSCTVYDVIFNPEALKLARQSAPQKQKLEEIAMETIETTFNVKLDKNNIRRPKLKYKGLKNATMIKYKTGSQPPSIVDPQEFHKESPPQKDEETQSPKKPDNKKKSEKSKNLPSPSMTAEGTKLKESTTQVSKDSSKDLNNGNVANDFKKPEANPKPTASQEWTEPHYSMKFRNHINIQDFCLDTQRDGRNVKPIPEEIELSIDLPLLRDSSNLEADVDEDGWNFELKTEKKILYKLNFKLPFQVYCARSKATFDKDTRKLTIVMKTIPKESVFIPSKPQLILSKNPDESGDHIPDSCEPKIQLLDDEKHDTVFGSMEKGPPSSFDSARSFDLSRSSSCVDYDTEDSTTHNFGSPNSKKTVRFSDDVQRQIYRSNSSILGQRKKNQRKAKNKKKSRERLNSGESVSSLSIDDEDEDEEIDGFTVLGGKSRRERFNSGGSISSVDEEFLLSSSAREKNPLHEEEAVAEY